MSTAMTTAFPHPTLTPITGKPKSAAVALFKNECFANALAAFSARGNGITGCLRIFLTGAEYTNRFGVPFVEPLHPGQAPTHQANPTQHQIIENNRMYQQDMNEFLQYVQVKAALKQQLLAAIEPLSDTICVVMQYFGGIKFGVGGLIRTYGAGARSVLQEASKQILIPKSTIRITVPSLYVGRVYDAVVVKASGVTGEGEGYDVDGNLSVSIARHPESMHCCLLYTSPSPRDLSTSRMPSSA